MAIFLTVVIRQGLGVPPCGRRWLAGAVLAGALAAACGGQATPAPPAAGTGSLSDWGQLGATEVPPASLRQVSLGAVEVQDEAGSVGDVDARAWADAFLRSLAYVRWAVSQGQDGFLLRAGLSAAPLAVFRPNLSDIAQARRAGDRVEYTPQTIRRLVVRAVPASLQPTFQRARFVWRPYAIYLDAVGPAATTWIDPRGGRTVKARIAAGAPAFELVGGELRHDPLLGDVWVLGSDFDCTAAVSRRDLTPACNP